MKPNKTGAGVQAGELIYLNYIEHRGKVWQVNDIFGASGLITVLPNNEGESLGRMSQFEFNPIPLTEQWLKEFGFDSINEDAENCNRNYTNTKRPQWWIQYHTEVNDFIFYGRNNSIEISVKSVHQLQNLYFALTHTHLHRTNTQEHEANNKKNI